VAGRQCQHDREPHRGHGASAGPTGAHADHDGAGQQRPVRNQRRYRQQRPIGRHGATGESQDGERPAGRQPDHRGPRAEIERLRQLLAAAEATSLVRRRTPGLAH
jgi:hypothetical protein